MRLSSIFEKIEVAFHFLNKLSVEFKPDKKIVIFLLLLLLFSAIIVPTLGLALGLAINLVKVLYCKIDSDSAQKNDKNLQYYLVCILC